MMEPDSRYTMTVIPSTRIVLMLDGPNGYYDAIDAYNALVELTGKNDTVTFSGTRTILVERTGPLVGLLELDVRAIVDDALNPDTEEV